MTHTAFVAEQTIESLKSHPARLSLPEFPPDVKVRRSGDSFFDEELRLARRGYYAMASKEQRQSVLIEMTGWKALRTAKFHYIVEATGRETLYNLGKDPAGYQDVAADPTYAPALAQLRQDLLVRLIERGRPLPPVWAY